MTSVTGYEDIISGSVENFLQLSKKIGGEVAQQSDFVKLAFQ